MLDIPAFTNPGFYLALLSFGGLWAVFRVLRWLADRFEAVFDRAYLEPLREKETARVAAFRTTLRAVENGIVPVPRVY